MEKVRKTDKRNGPTRKRQQILGKLVTSPWLVVSQVTQPQKYFFVLWIFNKSNNFIVVLILFSFLRALLRATLLNTIQRERFRLKIEKKRKTAPMPDIYLWLFFNNTVNSLKAPRIVEELWFTNPRQSPNFQSNALS